MKYLMLLILTINPIFGYSQSTNSLSEMLWNRVNKCYSMFEDINNDGNPDFDKIDDARNGYLQISGSWPTCGCSCSSTVGAYRNISGEYIVLQSDTELCTWGKKISSNKDLNEILPNNFGIDSFSSIPIDNTIGYPIFFINFEIPRIGTDTKVMIELVPFGLKPKGNGLLCYEYKEQERYSNCKPLFRIRDIAMKCQNIKTLDYIVNGEFGDISQIDYDVITKTIGNGSSRFESIEELQHILFELYQIYKIHLSLETTEIILSWDRQDSIFFIKEKKGKPENVSFKEFLINNKYWSPMC